jgi:hypothetical protein
MLQRLAEETTLNIFFVNHGDYGPIEVHHCCYILIYMAECKGSQNRRDIASAMNAVSPSGEYLHPGYHLLTTLFCSREEGYLYTPGHLDHARSGCPP